MKNYRLKKEAVPYFKEKHSTAIYSWETWESLQVDMSALEEVEEAFISYGHESEGSRLNSTSLCGWDKKGSRYHFTIHFPSMAHKEYDEFSKGKVMRELMDDIQKKINYFYQDFITK